MKEQFTNNNRNTQNAHDIPGSAPQEAQIRIDGFAQVLEMLKIADPEFRTSLLRRLSQRDPELALQLRKSLGI